MQRIDIEEFENGPVWEGIKEAIDAREKFLLGALRNLKNTHEDDVSFKGQLAELSNFRNLPQSLRAIIEEKETSHVEEQG